MAKRHAEELDARGYGDVDGALCLAHVTEPHFAARLTDEVTESACTFCGRHETEAEPAFAVPIEAVLEVFVETMHHFYADADAVLSWDNEDGLIGPQSETWEVVNDLASGVFDGDTDEAVIDVMIDAVGETITWTPFFSAGDLDDLEFAWEQFARTTRNVARFFFTDGTDGATAPARASRYLHSVLLYLEKDLGLVTELAVGTRFYRGRLCGDPHKIHADAGDLGPAPTGKASANRMSPAGISLFYASGDVQTAIAEIAGHGVEASAVMGAFTNVRPLRVLDLTREPPAISPFDVERREHARMGRFLASFVDHVTEPVIPDGRQHVEYAPTQVLTEFLRWVPDPPLDGIVLPSSQTHQPTYVLFFGPSAFRTKGGPDPRPVGLQFTGMDVPREDPDEVVWFELDPADVTTYRVQRTYSGTPMRWSQAAPARLRSS